MHKHVLAPLAVLLAFVGVAAPQVKKPMTEQQKRGHEVFVNSKKGAACATCHQMAGEGTAVGPNLTSLANAATPSGMRMAILATQTAYVQVVKFPNGSSFPGMKEKEDAGTVEFYDLSKMPPQLRSLKKTDLDSIGNNAEWKHPPESSGYTDAELEDVISYLRYVAKGDSQAVKLGQ